MRKYRAAGLVLITLVLGACGQQDASTESEQGLGIPIYETESSPGGGPGMEDNVADSLSAPDLEESLEESNSANVLDAGNEGQSESPAVGSPCDNAYLEALQNLLFYQQLPLGQEAENIPVTVYFAIQDIDGDGREELLIDYQGSVMASIQEMVYDYDESKGELYREIWDFPDIMYMSNGYARSDWSHNHTRSDFWPYNLYRYNSSTDQYELTFIVTAWDKELSETDAQGNSFPDAVDASNAGRVYMIEDGLTGEISAPMDTADYEKWYADTLGEYANDPTVVEWQLLAEENLRNK